MQRNRLQLFRRDRHTCAYCGGEFNFLRLTRDHLLPVSRGGRDVWMNVVAACRRCNQRKENRLPHEVGMKLARRPFVPSDGFRLSLGRPEPEWELYLG